MNIKDYIDPELYTALKTISQTDIIIKRIIEKDYKDIFDIMNSLASSTVCIYYRETSNQMLIQNLIESNPQVKTILQAKNDIVNVSK